MKKVTKEVLQESANRLLINLTDEELNDLLSDFDILISQMELIGDIPGVDEVEPMTFPFEITSDYLRDDIPEEPLSKNDVLKNAQDVVDGQIRLPKVVKK